MFSNYKLFFQTLILVLVVPVFIMIGCGKDLNEILFHVPIDKRISDSLSGDVVVPTPAVMADTNQFNFAIFADVQIKSENKNLLGRFKSDVASKGIKFFVVLGDLTEDGTQDEFTKVKADLEDVGIPYYLTIGNHDLFQSEDKGGWEGWKATFGSATYSVTIANAVRIILLDTSSAEVGSRQFDWLKEQLATQVKYTLVGSHYPIYDGITPSMWRLSSVDERYKLTSMLNQLGVYAYVGGHVHGSRQSQVGNVAHFIVGSMYPYDLDYGSHGYLLFKYADGKMTWEQVSFPDTP